MLPAAQSSTPSGVNDACGENADFWPVFLPSFRMKELCCFNSNTSGSQRLVTRDKPRGRGAYRQSGDEVVVPALHSSEERVATAVEPLPEHALMMKNVLIGVSAEPSQRTTVASTTDELPSVAQTQEETSESRRLQDQMIAFHRKAVRGCPCLFFSGGAPVSTQYRLDRKLQFLTFGPIPTLDDDRGERASTSCPIRDIQDVYSVAVDGEYVFPESVLSSVSEFHRDRLLMITYKAEDSQLARLCMVEDSRKSRDMFLECLKIINVYHRSIASSSR